MCRAVGNKLYSYRCIAFSFFVPQALADDCRQREHQRELLTKRKLEEYTRLQTELKVCVDALACLCLLV